MKRTILWSIVVLAFLSAGYSVQATTWDVAADFSETNNPNGAWSYGWSSTLVSPSAPDINLYTKSGKFDDTINPIIPVDVWAGSNFPYSPNVAHNGTGSINNDHPTIVWQPGQFSLHPGDNGEYSYARWIAPYAGTFDIAATFTGIDENGSTTDVHVLHNGNSLFYKWINLNEFGNTVLFPKTTVSVNMDDKIDFAVGYGNGAHTCDTTALSATISIPEPATLLLLGLGGMAIRKVRGKR